MLYDDPILKSGAKIPKLGQGTWHMGEDPSKESQEIEALRLGITLGLNLIDTAEMYANGRAESLVGKALVPFNRSDVYLVSKVMPSHGTKDQVIASCEASMQRLGTDYLDLYLLHWRSSEVPLSETVKGMEELIRQGKIRDWGVSNFDVQDMHDLWQTGGGANCSVNQVLYHVGSRGVEYDLLPWLRQKRVVMMAYCPSAQAGTLKRDLLRNPVIMQIAQAHHISVIQTLIAFSMYMPDVVSIPKASTTQHVKENAQLLKLKLTRDEIERINEQFPVPTRKVPLDMQ